MSEPRVVRIISVYEFSDGTFDAQSNVMGQPSARSALAQVDRAAAREFVLTALKVDES